MLRVPTRNLWRHISRTHSSRIWQQSASHSAPLRRGNHLYPPVKVPLAAMTSGETVEGPIVWVDCEMTGLDHESDKLMEIAVLITNGNLELVDEGIEYVIRVDKKHLDGMGEWCTKQHGESGLTQQCLSSPYSKDYVEKAVLTYIKKWVPKQRTAVLAGNSVHVDRLFLLKEMPQVVDWLHYRIIDVSSIKELVRRWYTHPSQVPPELAQEMDSRHRALSDIKGSIRELKWYRQNTFVEPLPSGK